MVLELFMTAVITGAGAEVWASAGDHLVREAARQNETARILINHALFRTSAPPRESARPGSKSIAFGVYTTAARFFRATII